MVKEVGQRGTDADFINALTAVDTTRLPPNALHMLAGLKTEHTRSPDDLAENVDWVAVGAVLREALGWYDYPASPPSDN